ncbi:unnamed protein product [Schistosoma guineensis]|nr:unnamed protein product [Schistosoma guineensis]
MDIDNDINQVLPAGKLAREPDRPTHICTSILQNPSSNSSKTVPFFPRVLLSVQQPLSSLINQTIIQPTALTTASGANTPLPHASSLHMSATSVSSPINSTNQFFPLILAAASTLPPSTSSAPTPLQLHLGNYSGSSSVASASSQSIFLHPSVTTTASCLSVPNVLNSPSRLGTSGVTTASTPLVASLINKNCSTSPSVASVVISPQAPNHIQPTLALRFATHTSTQCSAMVTTATVNSSACPLVFETPTTNVTLPLQSQRSHCVTAINFPAPTSVSGSLLMSSTLCSTPRVLIHKPQSLSNPPSLIENPTTSITTVSPSKMSTSDSSFTNLSNPAIIFHDQVNTQSPQTSKTKLVNFTTPLSATVRLITPPSTVCTTTKSTCTVSTSGNSALAFPTSLSQTVALSTRPSIANTGSVWSGLTVNPNVSFMSPSSGNVVAIQSSQSLIVQAQSDLPVQSTIATSSSLNPSLMMSLRSFSGSSSNTGPSLPLSAANHTVLAFNLANSNVHSTPTTCTSVTGMLTNPVRQINSSSPASPLIVRASGPSAVGYVPNTSTVMGPTSLLKPFNLSGNTGLSATSSSASVVPHILPVNIAPAKLTPLQPSISASTSSISHTRSNFSQNNSVCISSHRLPTSSIFSQPSRKRARKQQLASSFSSVMITPVSVVSSTTSTAVSMSSLVNPSSLNSVVSGCRSVLPSTPTLVAMAKPTIQPHQFAQPVYSCQVTHSPQISGSSTKSGPVSVDSVYRNTSATISVSCATNVSPSNSGLMGIRLVSVRSTPTTSVPNNSSILLNTTCFQSSTGSLGTRGSTGDNSVIMVTSPSQIVSSGGHLRITNSHCSQSSDIHQTQAAAVYVLTTSVYPILSTTTVTSSNSNSGSESACSASSIISPVVVSGSTNGVLQVRFRSPQPNISPTVMAENQESKSLQVVNHNILSTSLHSISDVSKSVSEDSKFINPTSKPLRCASESNPLLHHLVSSLKQSQNESTADVSHMNNTDLKKSDSSSTHSELSLSNSWSHNNIDDSKQINVGSYLNSNEKHTCFYPTTSRDNSDLNNDFTDCDSKILNEKQLTVPIHNIPRKKIKGEQEPNECQKADEITIKSDLHNSNKLSKAGILWTVDPVDGREWILNGRPPRPLINPKCGLSNSRLSVPCRSKSSHFLSLSEICTRPQHKSANPDDSSRRGVQNTRRRRRSLVTGTNMSHSESDIQSKGERDMNSLNSNSESNEAKRLVQDILAVRAEQEDSGFVRFPLTTTSVLDITGWRVLRCADNLDLLAYTELQTLETIKNMETDLTDQLHCISTQSVTSSLLSVSQGVSETAKSIESGLKSDESEMASQFNVAIELIKGISQRKKYLLDSIQRISSVTKNLVHHFSPGIHNLIEELEDSPNSSSKSLSPSSSKTNLDSNTLSTPITLRRSSRSYEFPDIYFKHQYPMINKVVQCCSVTGISQEIENLKLTLNQINTCLVEENDQLKCSDLLNLKKDLEELIELKENELLNSRKAQLLAEIGSILTDNQEKDDELQGTSLQTDSSTINEESLVGQRCSVPGWTSSGKFIRQNALILSVVGHDGDSPDRVRVLLAHPTRLNEIPCERFFETGTCHRGIRCTRSHGKIFNIEDIGEWYEPDTEKYLHEGQPCLANDRKSDHNSLWHYARLLQTDFESGTCVVEWGHGKSQPDKNSVKRQSYGNLEDKVTSLPLECIHILENDDDIDSDVSVVSDISSSTTNSGDSRDYLDLTTSYTRPSIELINSGQTTESQSCSQYDKRRFRVQFVFGNTLLPDQRPNLDTGKEYPNVNKEDKQSSIGDWEAHTRGIGSRLLASMGYPGYGGLGRCHQGRQSPVCTNLEKYQVHNVKWNHRPSLDNVVLSRKRVKNIKCRDKTIEMSSKTSKNHVSHSGSVFKLINMALSSTSSNNDQNPKHPNSNNNYNTKSTVTSQNSLTNCNESILKRKLFHTYEQINRLHNQISKAQDSMRRNEGRDRLAVKQAQQLVNDLQSQLIQLKENERTIVNMQNKQMKEKKLRIF